MDLPPGGKKMLFDKLQLKLNESIFMSTDWLSLWVCIILGSGQRMGVRRMEAWRNITIHIMSISLFVAEVKSAKQTTQTGVEKSSTSEIHREQEREVNKAREEKIVDSQSFICKADCLSGSVF